MAFYQILYWQDIPAQIKAWDDFDEIKADLPPAFLEKIDRVAQAKGLTGTDDYLNQWGWGEAKEQDGAPEEVVAAVKAQLEAKLNVNL